jgi:hypothetical protein
MNPFLTVQILLSALLRWIGWTSATNDASKETANDPSDEAITWMLFATLLPLAFLWTKMFAKSGRNFAENYVLGLYVLGLLGWLELLLLPFTYVAGFDLILFLLLAILWLTMTTWAGTVFYSIPWYSVVLRMAISTAVAFVLAGLVLAIFI